MDKDELIMQFDAFLNDNGLFYQFKDWAEGRGFTVDEFGFADE